MSKTAQKHKKEKKIENTNSFKLKKINMSDDETGIHNLLVDATQNPQKMKPQGMTILSVFTAVSEKYDISIDDLTNNMISCDYEDYKTQTRKAIEIVRKKDKKKDEKFQAYMTDSNGDFILDKKNNKIPLKSFLGNDGSLKINLFFKKVYGEYITDNDKANTKYFKNGKFDRSVYIKLKWDEIKDPSNKTHKKLLKRLKEENDKIDLEIKRQREKSGYVTKPKKATPYNLFIKVKSQKYKDNEKFKNLKQSERMPFIAKEWKKLNESKKSKYVKMAEQHNVTYVKNLAKWEEYNKKKAILFNNKGKDNSKSTNGDSSNNNTNTQGDIYDGSTEEEDYDSVDESPDGDGDANKSNESTLQLSNMIDIIQNNTTDSNHNSDNEDDSDSDDDDGNDNEGSDEGSDDGDSDDSDSDSD